MYFSFTHICVHIVCRFSDTRTFMTPQNRCYARDPKIQKKIYKAWFATSRIITSLANSGSVIYQSHMINVIIEIKHDVPCIVRSQALRGQLGYVSALGATLLVNWLAPVAPSCFRFHSSRYIMLKSLNIFSCFILRIFEAEGLDINVIVIFLFKYVASSLDMVSHGEDVIWSIIGFTQ